MQLKPAQLMRQQIVMTYLGFYKHKVDGIWGPASIEAKRKWESDKSFIPALPSNGMPLGDRDKAPRGIMFDRSTRLFSANGLTEDKIKELTDSVVVVEPVVELPPVVASPDDYVAIEEVSTASPSSSEDNPHRLSKKEKRFEKEKLRLQRHDEN